MSKRKRASVGKTPAGPTPGSVPDDAADDAAVKEDMVHVAPDLLAGSPDIFAGKRAGAADAPDMATEPTEEPAPIEPEPTEASTTLTPSEEAPAPTPQPAEAPPPPFVSAVAYPTRSRRGGSSTALGIVLVVIGLFALVVVLSGVDLTESGWPLFIIIPGFTLIVVGFLRIGA